MNRPELDLDRVAWLVLIACGILLGIWLAIIMRGDGGGGGGDAPLVEPPPDGPGEELVPDHVPDDWTGEIEGQTTIASLGVGL